MTTEILDAIFEHGSFRLLKAPDVPLQEGQHVRLVVQTERSPEAMIALASSVYAGLTPKEIDEIERIALKRNDFFGENA